MANSSVSASANLCKNDLARRYWEVLTMDDWALFRLFRLLITRMKVKSQMNDF